MATKLPAKQALFVAEYLIDLNATRAAQRAGYKEPNKQGPRLLVNVGVQAEIQRAQAKREKRTDITQDRVLKEFARIAFFDPRKLFNPDGSPKSILDLDDDTAAVIAGLDVAEMFDQGDIVGVIKKWKLADKTNALIQIGRHLGMFNDKTTVKFDLSNLSDEELESLEQIQSKIAPA